MSSVRFTTLDCAAACCCVSAELQGRRVANVYDVVTANQQSSSGKGGGGGRGRVWMLRFHAEGSSAKAELIIEAGMAIYTTRKKREVAASPTNFTSKLRKHLKGSRLRSVSHLGIDRVACLSFGGTSDATGSDSKPSLRCHLIVEFHSGGNLILCDDDFRVLTLLRSHRDDNKGIAIMPNHLYPISSLRRLDTLPTVESVRRMAGTPGGAKGKTTLKSVLQRAVPSMGPVYAHHCLLEAGLDPDRAIGAPEGENGVPESAGDALSDDDAAAMVVAIRTYVDLLARYKQHDDNERFRELAISVAGGGADDCGVEERLPRGYIIFDELGKHEKFKSKMLELGQAASAAGIDAKKLDALNLEVFDTVCSFQYAQNEGRRVLEFDTFTAALDEFYAKGELQKAAIKSVQAEMQAQMRLTSVRRDVTQRVEALERNAMAAERKAEVLIANLELVQECIDIVNEEVESGADWSQLHLMLEREKELDPTNEIANMIRSLHLDRNAITIELTDASDGEEKAPPVVIELDLTQSAFANASSLYSAKKKQNEKQQKTIISAESAIKTAEKKAAFALSAVQGARPPVDAPRRKFWFEGYDWFISSDGFLCVGGRDTSQSDALVERHMRASDVVVHADISDCPIILIKRTKRTAASADDCDPPPSTLISAGIACLARSQAWTSKITTEPFYTHASHIGKLDCGNGDRLPAGQYSFREKLPLPPAPLVMGFGFVFKHVLPRDEDSSAATEDEDDDDDDDGGCKGTHGGQVDLQPAAASADESDRLARDTEVQVSANAALTAARIGVDAPGGSDGGGEDALRRLVAFPVCAPYKDMQKLKYKVKLVPGTGKRLKTAKTCISIFCAGGSTSKLEQRERDLMRQTLDSELTACMISGVKASAAGMTKTLTDKRKSDKHKGKKKS